MGGILIQHTNRLINSATAVAASNNIKTIPFPKQDFKSEKDFEKYLQKLTSFIKNPELYYLSRKQMNSVNINNVPNLTKNNFKFL